MIDGWYTNMMQCCDLLDTGVVNQESSRFHVEELLEECLRICN